MSGGMKTELDFKASLKCCETGVQLVYVTPLGRCVYKAGLKTVARQRIRVLSLQAGGGKGLGKVVIHVAAKVGRVI